MLMLQSASQMLVFYTILTSYSDDHYFNCFARLCCALPFPIRLIVLAPLAIHKRLQSLSEQAIPAHSSILILDPSNFSPFLASLSLLYPASHPNQSRIVKYFIPTIHRTIYHGLIVPFVYQDVTLIPPSCLTTNFGDSELVFVRHPRFSPVQEFIYCLLLSKIHYTDIFSYMRLLLFPFFPLSLGGFFYSSGTSRSLDNLSIVFSFVLSYTSTFRYIRDQVVISYAINKFISQEEYGLLNLPLLTSYSNYFPYIRPGTFLSQVLVSFKSCFRNFLR
jgi:hypothetical protein